MQLHAYLFVFIITTVQEVMTNSSEDHTSLDSGQDLSPTIPWAQTGTRFTSWAPVVPQRGQEAVGGTEKVIGHPSQGLGWSSGPRSGSGPSLQDQRLLHPPSPLSGLTMAGPADRETPPLPQEEPDNGADMSGAARVTEGHNSVGENTHIYFQTQQHTLTTDTLSHTPHIHSTERHARMQQALDRDTLLHTKRTHTLTDAAARSAATDIHTYTVIHTGQHTGRHTATHTSRIDPTVPSSGGKPSSPPQRSLLTSAPDRPWVTDTIPTPHGGPADGKPGESKPPAWRSQRSTDRLHSNLTLSVTSDPLRTSGEPQREGSNSTDLDIGIDASSYSRRPGSLSPTTHHSELVSSVGTGMTASPLSDTRQMDPSASADLTVTSQRANIFAERETLRTLPPKPSPATTQAQTNPPVSQHTDGLTRAPPSYTFTPYTQAYNKVTRTETQNAHNLRNSSNTYATSNNFSARGSPPPPTPSETSLEITKDYDWTTSSTGPLPSTTAPLPRGDAVTNSTTVASGFQSSGVTATTVGENNTKDGEAVRGTGNDTETYTFSPTRAPLPAVSHPRTSVPVSLPTRAPSSPFAVPCANGSADLSEPEGGLHTQAAPPGSSRITDPPLISYTTASPAHTPLAHHKTRPAHLPSPTPTPKALSSHTPQTHTPPPWPSSSDVSPTHKRLHDHVAATQTALASRAPSDTEPVHGVGRGGGEMGKEGFITTTTTTTAAPSQSSPSGPATRYLTARPWEEPPSTAAPYPQQGTRLAGTASVSPPSLAWSSTTTQTPKFYIVPDQPATIKEESIELLLQILVEESSSAFTAGLEEDTTAWVEPYLLRAPGFSKLMGVWSRGLAVQSLVEFRTRGALDWLGMAGPASLLERTGLAQAVREGRSFRGSKITNITVGGLQEDVCDWLLQCPAGYDCVSQSGTANHSCSSVCHYDYCHHHGICTHHPEQLPICRCLVGEDFWYMGQRCDVKMTRTRLVGACLAILVIMVTLIAILALVAVRRYRAILIQAKVDQTRSSYRRFNHFDELSGRFWLRSWAGSADSLDNPAFTRSDELLHLRALDRTCCYHDDTLSLASTCPSNGTHLNTVFPHSSQYGWRGSEMSMGECVLDSGKASDLSVCSWPVEPIQWTPFPLLQQLASHRTATVRASRPRSYCEGMELVDLGKSWTA